jgi:hypothetical protein
MSAIYLSFDMSHIPDLVPKLHAIHAYQLLHILLFNRAQRAMVAILQFARTLGYNPMHTDVQLIRLMEIIRAFSVLMNIIHDTPPFESNNLLTVQILDGFSRTVHLLPDHVRTDVNSNLQYFEMCSKANMFITPGRMLIPTSSILRCAAKPICLLLRWLSSSTLRLFFRNSRILNWSCQTCLQQELEYLLCYLTFRLCLTFAALLTL